MARMKRLNLHFVKVMLVYGGAIFLVYRDEVLGPSLAPLAVLTARMTLQLLRAVDVEVLQEGAKLSHPAGFAYEIAYDCTGFLPIVTFLVCVLAYSGPVSRKCAGIALGVPILLAVNLFRLAHLFYVGVHFPDEFTFAHEVLWEGLLTLVFCGLWWGWTEYCARSLINVRPN